MILPDYYLITPEPKDPTRFLNTMQQQLDRGIKLLRLRANNLSLAQYQNLTLKLIELAKPYDAKLMLSGDPAQLTTIPAAGVHLNSEQLQSLSRRPIDENHYLAASCHNQQEIKAAEKLGVDFITLSPVLPTQSHPGADNLGWQSFTELCQSTDLAVYGLGGLQKNDLTRAKAAGAVGIAGIRLFIS